ncbi:YitT family protein [Ponticaulis sp.]|uniref:YitT family protein n=1 Tax=Ponticaulis sp. TaxID=2020902 RepID=UPI000C613846|nr:YitT family protein [Ponticaulis sp.]MAJ10557.1 hypothetical protein [Ponticaulis sp.]HBH89764.1 hypothetical protein [Hyphomonadaceae bacterium]HBJ92844.1 hypothetical protein [Hyphomonadaceae bacterium]
MSDISAPSNLQVEDENTLKHKWYEDVFAILLGALFIGMGVTVYSEAMLLTGGVAGMSLILSYIAPLSFGAFFFLLNLPFYLLAILRMGWEFTLKTVVAVTLVSIFPNLVTGWIAVETLSPLFAAILGGAMIGMGMIALFRHGAGIGGVSILAHFLQEKGIMRAGWVLLSIDAVILVASAFVLPLTNLVYSVVGAVVLNLMVGINHRPGRYFGR